MPASLQSALLHRRSALGRLEGRYQKAMMVVRTSGRFRREQAMERGYVPEKADHPVPWRSGRSSLDRTRYISRYRQMEAPTALPPAPLGAGGSR